MTVYNIFGTETDIRKRAFVFFPDYGGVISHSKSPDFLKHAKYLKFTRTTYFNKVI